MLMCTMKSNFLDVQVDMIVESTEAIASHVLFVRACLQATMSRLSSIRWPICNGLAFCKP